MPPQTFEAHARTKQDSGSEFAGWGCVRAGGIPGVRVLLNEHDRLERFTLFKESGTYS